MIPTKDRHDQVGDTVRQLLQQRRLPQQIVVVDASKVPWLPSPELGNEADQVGVALTIIREQPSTSAQRNAGIRAVETPLVLLLDDDVVLSDDYMGVLLARWERWGLDHLGGVVGSRRGHRVPRGRVVRQVLQVHTNDPKGAATRLRASGKLEWVDTPDTDVIIPAVGAGAVTFRTDLLRKHRFDEHFPGYALGEDLDLAQRISRDAPILQTPDAWFLDLPGPGGGTSEDRWYIRGRRETYFRMKHLRKGAVSKSAFAVSIVGEAAGAAIDSFRERNPRYFRDFLVGITHTLREKKTEQFNPRPYYTLVAGYQQIRVRRSQTPVAVPTWAGTRVLGYHRVSDDRDPLAVTPARFRAQIESMLSAGIVPVDLASSLDPEPADQSSQRFCITFDDGYLDVIENAVPILEELDVPATIYVTTWVLDGSTTFAWYDVQPPIMTWSELRDLATRELFDVGAHTRTHSLLPYLPREQARREIAGSRWDVEEQLGGTVTSFCYPAGLYGERDVELVREAGFTTAVTTNPGVVRSDTGPFTMPRTMISGRDNAELFRGKVTGAFDERTPLDRWLFRRRSLQIHGPQG